MTGQYLDILYQDEFLIAINKPAGLLVHPSWLAPRRTPNLVFSLSRYFKGAPVYTIHRLDRATSGVILFAKDKATAQAMNAQFQEHKVDKHYLCVTRGYAPEEGYIDYALKPILDKRDDARSDPDKEPKPSQTAFERLATVELPIPVGKWPAARYSLVKAMPKTGRKHQLRRHFKHILCPLIGDTKYGEGRHNRLFRENLDSHRLLLMATDLWFDHPHTGERIHIQAPVSQKAAALFDRLGWQGLYPKRDIQHACIEQLAGEIEVESPATDEQY